MAKNWTLKEAFEVIGKGTDKEAMQEIGKRFPLTSIALAKTETSDGLTTIMNALPDHVTALKIERALKEGVQEAEDTDVEEVVEGEVKEEAAAEEDLSSMSTKELMKLCDKRGIKVPHYGKNKQFYLEKLQGGSEAAEEVEETAEPEVAEEETEESPYAGKTAMELYKMCKKRGLKVEAKQKQAYYISALEADDAKEAEAEEDDEWEEEPVKEEKPAKKAKAAKKAKVEEEDDDDDWDI